MKEYNSKKVNTSPVGQSDVDAVMKKYDRESNIRIWTCLLYTSDAADE